MIKRALYAITLLAVTLGAPLNSHGHALNQSYVFLGVTDESLGGRVEMTIADLNAALGLSLPEDGSATQEQLAPHIDGVYTYFRQHVGLAVDGRPAALPITGHSLSAIELAQYLQVAFVFPDLPGRPQSVDVNFSMLFDVRPTHRGMLVIENDWGNGTFNDESNVALVFAPGSERQTLDLSSSSTFSGFYALLKMGVHHIWIGIDHILFLLALLLPAVMLREKNKWVPVGDFKSALIHVVKVVTVFTIAHSITLSLASLNVITLSSRLVESIIAISIAIAALDIVVPIFKHRIWWIVFGFGLFHGFGFASILSELDIPATYLVYALLGFNLGVEIGQVVIVLIIFPILYWVRNSNFYPVYAMQGGAALLILIALYWFIERAFMVDLPAGAILNKVIGVAT